MPPKSDPPIVEASVEMGFVASLYSEVVVKLRCEEEEVLGKSEILIDHRNFQSFIKIKRYLPSKSPHCQCPQSHSEEGNYEDLKPGREF